MSLWNDVDAMISGIKFSETGPYAVQGKQPLWAHVEFKMPDGELKSQAYSMGASASDSFLISEDGTDLHPNPQSGKENPALSKGTNFMLFMESLAAAGVPAAKFEGTGGLIGIWGHFKRVPVTREGIKKEEGDKAQTVLVMERMVKAPVTGGAGTRAATTTGTTTGTTTTTTKTTAPAQAAATTAGLNLEGVVMGSGPAAFITSLLIANDGQLTIPLVNQAILKLPLPARKPAKDLLANAEALAAAGTENPDIGSPIAIVDNVLTVA